MNGYELSRRWFDYMYSRSGIVKPIHTHLYFYIIELWNRLGQIHNFGLPTHITMQSLGIGSYNTYKKALSDIIEWGFIDLIQESTNQYNSKVIALSKSDKAKCKKSKSALDEALLWEQNALSKNDEPTDKATDEANVKSTDKSEIALSKSDKATDEPTDKATDTIIEPINKETIKLNSINNIPENKFSGSEISDLEFSDLPNANNEIPIQENPKVTFSPGAENLGYENEKLEGDAKKNKGKKLPKEKNSHPAYKPIVEYWLKVYHPGFSFNAMSGLKINSIIKKIETLMRSAGNEPNPEEVLSSFVIICQNLPEWFRDKDLPVIDSKFNEIVLQIKNSQNGNRVNKSAGGKYSAAASYFD